MKEYVIINGPNLNLLGRREPEIYGHVSFEDFMLELEKEFPDIQLKYFQSNVEGEIINELQRIGFLADGIILNAGGYTHTSVAIADAVVAIESPVIEVHISQPQAREYERHRSLLSKYVKASVSGMGLDSYRYAIMHLIKLS